MRANALERAVRARRSRAATFAQRRYLAVLARRTGVELPHVASYRDAHRAIERLLARLRQPTLEEAT